MKVLERECNRAFGGELVQEDAHSCEQPFLCRRGVRTRVDNPDDGRQ
jgi:hypothetical protein